MWNKGFPFFAFYGSFSEITGYAKDLTTGNAADIIDLSSLPDSAIDGGVFADLLPYIDSGPEICREDAEKLRNLVYATEKTVHDEEELLNILKEGAEPYFSGQKTLDGTAARIPSRRKIYVAEHR